MASPLEVAGKQLAVPDGAIVVVAQLTALAGRESAVQSATERLVEAVHANEVGCLLFVAHKGANVPGDVLFWEVFEDQTAFEAHKSSDHLAAWLKEIDRSTATAIDVHVLTPIRPS